MGNKAYNILLISAIPIVAFIEYVLWQVIITLVKIQSTTYILAGFIVFMIFLAMNFMILFFIFGLFKKK